MVGQVPTSDKKLSDLWQAIHWSRRRMQPFREKRLRAIRQYVGFNYSDDGSLDRVPVGLLEMLISVYTSHLSTIADSVSVSTRIAKLKMQATTLTLVTRFLINELRIRDSLEQIVRDALFSVGIAKVGLERFGSVEVDSEFHDVGRPFVNPVSLDDFVIDMQAKRFGAHQYIGNRYRLPYEEVMQSPWFENKDQLSPVARTSYNEFGDEREGVVSAGEEGDPDDYCQEVELWDIYVPRENMMITLPSEEAGGGLPIMERKWDGPEIGPYRMLGFGDVPGNLMPLSPVSTIMDLHELANRIFNKLGRQTDRQKTVLGVDSSATDDGTRIVNASDGDVIALDHPDKGREYRFGGIDQISLGFLLQVKQLFSYFGGNIDVLGGLGPQSDTLGQDQLITAGANMRMQMLQRKAAEFSQGVLRDVAWYAWQDPMFDPTLAKRVEGTDIEVPVSFKLEEREGDFFDFNFKVDAYAEPVRSPSQKLQTTMMIFERLIGPYLPMIQQAGAMLDWQAFLKQVADQAGMTEEFSDFLRYSRPDPVMQQMMGGGGQSSHERTMAPNTTRTNVRVNRPGATQQGQDQEMAKLMFGGNSQPSQRASLARQAG